LPRADSPPMAASQASASSCALVPAANTVCRDTRARHGGPGVALFDEQVGGGGNDRLLAVQRGFLAQRGPVFAPRVDTSQGRSGRSGGG
jgi:hypothetical protein